MYRQSRPGCRPRPMTGIFPGVHTAHTPVDQSSQASLNQWPAVKRVLFGGDHQARTGTLTRLPGRSEHEDQHVAHGDAHRDLAECGESGCEECLTGGGGLLRHRWRCLVCQQP